MHKKNLKTDRYSFTQMQQKLFIVKDHTFCHQHLVILDTLITSLWNPAWQNVYLFIWQMKKYYKIAITYLMWKKSIHWRQRLHPIPTIKRKKVDRKMFLTDIWQMYESWIVNKN